VTRRTLTDRACKAAKPAKAGARYDLKDSVVPGLALRVTDSGHKSFVLVARFPGSNNPTRRALRSYGALSLDAARKKARLWLELIAKGIDPGEHEERERAAALRKRANTFAAVAADFFRDKLPSERCGKEAERDIRRWLLPQWGALPVAEITEEHVRNLVAAISKRGKRYMARNILTMARRLFNWATDTRAYGLEHNPCERLKPNVIAGPKQPRTRVLDNAELRALWHAAEQMAYPYGALYRALLLTGQRLNEVAEARWSEIDLKQKLWVIPPSRMKSGAAHVVPLSDDMVRLLESLPRFNRGDFVFSSRFGIRPVSGFSVNKRALDVRMRGALGNAFKDFRVHDIRRSVRTGLSAIPNISDLVRELVIGHTKPGLHRVYDQHAYLDEKRQALDAWAARLRGIVGADSANVVPLRA
jgi:integrase